MKDLCMTIIVAVLAAAFLQAESTATKVWAAQRSACLTSAHALA